MDFKLKGIENRKKRAVKTWMKFKVLYDAGITVDEIRQRIKKKNGAKYSRGYIYLTFKKLEKHLSGKGANETI